VRIDEPMKENAIRCCIASLIALLTSAWLVSTAIAAAPDSAALMNWAEKQYPQYFPALQQNRFFAPYVYRYYPQTATYLGVDGDKVVVLGPWTGNALLTVGRLADFTCLVSPAECASGPTPRFATEPSDAQVQAGTRHTLEVAPSAGTAVTVQWYRNGVRISGANALRYTTPELTMVDDGAHYSAVLRNSGGATTSREAKLSMQPGKVAATHYLVGHAGPVQNNAVFSWAEGATGAATAGLVAVDPRRPGDLISVAGPGQAIWLDAGYGQSTVMMSFGNVSTYSFSASPLPDLRPIGEQYLVVIERDRFWVADLSLAAGWPGLRPLSNVNTSSVCIGGLRQFDDTVRPHNSSLLIRLPAARSGTCTSNDTTWVQITPDMGSGDAPRPAGEVIEVLRSGDGAIDGYLVREGNNIVRVDPRFNALQLVVTLNSATNPEIVHNEWGRIDGWLLLRTGNQLLAVEWDRPERGTTTLATVQSDFRFVHKSTVGAGPIYFIEGGFFKRLDTTGANPARSLLRIAAPKVRYVADEAGQVVFEIIGRLMAYQADGTMRTIATDYKGIPLHSCVPAPGYFVCGLDIGAATVERGGANAVSMLPHRAWFQTVVGSNVWGATIDTSSSKDPRYLAVALDGTRMMAVDERFLMRLASVDSDEFRRSPAQVSDDTAYSGRLLSVVQKLSAPKVAFVPQIVDGVTRATITDYGPLPSSASAPILPAIGWGPFHRAAVTGKPQLMRLLGVTNIRGQQPTVLHDLMLMHGTGPGMTRLTSHIPP